MVILCIHFTTLIIAIVFNRCCFKVKLFTGPDDIFPCPLINQLIYYCSKAFLHGWCTPNKMQSEISFLIQEESNLSYLSMSCISGDVSIIYCCTVNQEFDDSGDPERHFEALLSLAMEGVEKGKVSAFFSS